MRQFFFVAAMVLALASCDSAKDRAQKHFESAVALIKGGDIDRGLVELRNVFKLDKEHVEARRLFARTVREQGNVAASYAQYQRLAEQDPGDTEALKALADMAFESGDPNEARTRVDAALAVMPDDPTLQAYDAALDYHAAQGDKAAQADAAGRAQALLKADPTLLPARQVVVADLIAAQQMDAALQTIDAGLKIDSKPRVLHQIRLAVLQQLGDKDGIESELKSMVALYPDDAAINATLVRWYISEGRLDDAEAWLRRQIPEDGTDPTPRVTLVRFLSDLRGPSAALDELDRILSADPEPADVAGNEPMFRSLRAGFKFTLGQRDEAMTELEALLDAAPAASDKTSGEGSGGADTGATGADQVNRIKVALAKMRATTGNQVGARSLVEEVLAEDPGNAEALKLKGGWLIEDDQTDEAIATLREALNAAPRDSEIMLLLARAYERQGNRQLTGQMLSQAVEVSNRAPNESAIYANYLMQDGNLRSAEDVLVEALRLDSSNVDLLGKLAQVHLAMKDWARAEADIARLRELAGSKSGARAAATADEMQARLLAARGDAEELTGFLEGLADSAKLKGEGGGTSLGAEAAVIRSLVVGGKVDEAESRARALVKDMPDNPAAKFVLASVLMLTEQGDEAEALLRAVTDASPTFEPAWTSLYTLNLRKKDIEGATAVLDAAQEVLPDSMTLKWTRAGLLERTGDVEGAIKIYEALYETNSNLPVIANNLASLLSSARDDDASLERAWTVARRLKDTKVPAFADTYGWIAFRRGEPETALPYVELAAEGLPLDPVVPYHLGMVYAALNRPEDARAAFERSRQRITDMTPGLPGLAGKIDQAEQALEGG